MGERLGVERGEFERGEVSEGVEHGDEMLRPSRWILL